MFRLIVAGIVFVILAPLTSYVSGRILLPEMGLTAPPYSAWFWSMILVGAIVAGIKVVATWIMGD